MVKLASACEQIIFHHETFSGDGHQWNSVEQRASMKQLLVLRDWNLKMLSQNNGWGDNEADYWDGRCVDEGWRTARQQPRAKYRSLSQLLIHISMWPTLKHSMANLQKSRPQSTGCF